MCLKSSTKHYEAIGYDVKRLTDIIKTDSYKANDVKRLTDIIKTDSYKARSPT